MKNDKKKSTQKKWTKMAVNIDLLQYKMYRQLNTERIRMETPLHRVAAGDGDSCRITIWARWVSVQFPCNESMFTPVFGSPFSACALCMPISYESMVWTLNDIAVSTKLRNAS